MRMPHHRMGKMSDIKRNETICENPKTVFFYFYKKHESLQVNLEKSLSSGSSTMFFPLLLTS